MGRRLSSRRPAGRRSLHDLVAPDDGGGKSRVNAALFREVLDAIRPDATPGHVALVTGLKHRLGPF